LAAVPSIGRAANVEPRVGADGALALEGLYERHSQRVFRYCLAYLRKRDEAEDAAQTTFLHALGALRRGVVPNSESAWLLKIARNVCLTRFDSVKRRGNLELIQDPHLLAETASARPGSNMDLLGLQAALERLPERQRQAILLREWQGLSYAEIATELEMSISAVETLIFRARRALARELGGEERRRRGLDLAALLGWAKALFGGAAGKIVVGAAVVAALGTVGPLAEHSPGSGALPARQPLAEPITQQSGSGSAGSVSFARLHGKSTARAAHRSGPAAAATVSTHAAALVPRRTAPAAPAPSAPHVPAAPHGTVAPAAAPTAGHDPPPSAPATPPAVPVAAPSLPDPTQTLPVPVPDPIPVPTVPNVPDLPAVPNVPDLPAVPNVPDLPPVGNVPAPSVPSVPPVPVAPAVPPAPSLPTTAPSLPPPPSQPALPKLP